MTHDEWVNQVTRLHEANARLTERAEAAEKALEFLQGEYAERTGEMMGYSASAAVAEHVMGHVVTPRRDVFMSGGEGPIIGYVEARPDGGAWNLSRYSDNPAASYALRQKMRELGFWVEMCNRPDGSTWCWTHRNESAECEENPRDVAATSEWSECAAVAVESLRALNVEFTLAENWDKN